MQILLEAGASKECEDDYGITPLFIAAQYGKLECLRLLISFGNNDHSFIFVVLNIASTCHQVLF